MARTPGVTRERKKVWLDAFVRCGTIRGCVELTGMSRSVHYRWLEIDPDYRAAFAQAEVEAVEVLETEARRRALDGVEKPIYYRDQQVGAVREHSDQILMFLLRAARPEKYRERIDLTVDIRKEAERLASEAGVSADELVAEAERIVAQARAANGG